MTKQIIAVVLFPLMMSLPACTSTQWQADHLDKNIDHITQEQVMSTFGKPDIVLKGVAGGVTWIYRYSYTTIGGTAVVGKTQCWENVLWFDRTGVLRNRERRACSINGSSPVNRDTVRLPRAQGAHSPLPSD